MTRPPASAVLWLIPAVYFVFVAAEFALMTHMALQATAAGRSALVVGALAGALWGGILLASSVAHTVVQRHGHGTVFVAATALAFVATVAAALHENIAGWLVGAFVLGLCGGWVWVAGESWLAEAAPPEQRGLYVGFFETAVGLGLMVGPALVPLMRWVGVPTPWASAALMLAACLASLGLRRFRVPGVGVERPPGSAHGDTLAGLGPAAGAGQGVAAGAPAWRALAFPLLGIAVLSGLMESGVSALLPSISMRLGQSLEQAAWLGAVIGAGSALLQPPAGHLADRLGVRRITLLAWGIVLLANLVLLLASADPMPALWAVGFTLGGVGGAIYTLMIVELGHRLTGPALVRAIGALVTAYALGTAVGPVLGGSLFDLGGLRALATALLALSAIGLGVTYRCLANTARQAPAPQA